MFLVLLSLNFTECKDSNQVTPPNNNNIGTIEYVSDLNNLRFISPSQCDFAEDSKGDVWLVQSGSILPEPSVYRFNGNKIAQKFSAIIGNVNSVSFLPIFAKNKSGDIFVHGYPADLTYSELYKISNSSLVSVMKGPSCGELGANFIFFNKVGELEVFSGSTSNPFYDNYNLSNKTTKKSVLGFNYQKATIDGLDYWYVNGRKLFKSGVAVNPAKEYTDVKSSQNKVYAFSINMGLDILQSGKWTFVNSNLSINYPMDFRPMNFSISTNGDVYLSGSKGANADIGCVIKIGSDLTVSEISLDNEFSDRCYNIVRTFSDSKGFLWMIYINKKNAYLEVARLKL